MVNQRIETITADILKSLKIKKAKDIDLMKISNFLKVDVREEVMGEDISGLFVIKDTNAYIRFNSSESEQRQRFTIAHELGHFVLHKDTPLFVDKKNEKVMYRNSESTTGEIRKEREANAFAASLLMPSQFIETELQKMPFYEEPIGYLSNIFGVSEQAMSFRLANLGYDIGLY